MLKVPLTLVGQDEGLSKGFDSQQPCLFTVYGAYGVSLKTDFHPMYLPLLRRGWTIAFAHIRGGGELGREWHHKGRIQGKLQALQVDQLVWTSQAYCEVPILQHWKSKDDTDRRGLDSMLTLTP